LAEAQRRIDELHLRVLLICGGVIIGTVLAAWVISLVMVNPFRLLAQQARAINAQSNPDEVQVRGVQEAVEIAEAVEGMLDRIGKEQQRTKAALESARDFAAVASQASSTSGWGPPCGLCSSGASVVGLVARFPLDVAADAGDLVAGNRLARQHSLDGPVEVIAGDWLVVARPTRVKLASVGQLAVLIEEEQIRCAGGPERASDLLGLIQQVREAPPVLLGEGRHVLGPVLRVGGGVVGVDRQHGQTLVHPLTGPLPECRPDVDDVRAVVADEGHQQARGPGHVGRAVQLSLRVGEPEVGHPGAQGKHHRVNSNHSPRMPSPRQA
jgi:hypothetical protein